MCVGLPAKVMDTHDGVAVINAGGAEREVSSEMIADLILDGCLRCREQSGRNVVALSGGVFQNLLLTDMTVEKLEQNGFHVLTHSLSAPNDGGIGLGQALFGMFNK